MYELFLESKAAKQCEAYAQQNNVDAEELLQKLYANNKRQEEVRGKNVEHFWIECCLKNNSHLKISVDNMCVWFDTEEGHNFWSKIHNVRLA